MDKARQHSLYYWQPNPGRQTEAWCSTKDIVFISGGNRAGKSALLCHLAAAHLLPHPDDPDFSYYPCLPDWDQLNPYDNPLTNQLRAERKVKLPSIVWFSTVNMGGHKDVAMEYFPHLLANQIETEEWSDEPGVWSRVILKNGSQLHLKSAAQGLAGFQRANVDLICNDEPFDQALYGEQLARLLDRKGRLVIGATAITSDTAPTTYKRSEWLINAFAEPHKRGDLPSNVDVFSIPLTENPHIDKDYAEGIYAMLPDAERRARVDGEMILMQGECYFNRDLIQKLSHKSYPPEEGSLDQELEFVPLSYESREARLRLWQDLDPELNYVLGVDPSNGGDDPSVVRIWSDNPRMLVGELRGWIPEDQLPGEIIRIAHRLSNNMDGGRTPNVMAAVEANSGRLTLSALQHGNTELGVMKPLPRLYFRPKPAMLARGSHYPSDQLGWHTTPSNRGHLLAAVTDMLVFAGNQAERTVFPDQEGLREDYYWFIWEKGKPQARQGKHDDRVIADGLAWLAFRQKMWKQKAEPLPAEVEVVPFGIVGNKLELNLHGLMKPPNRTDRIIYG